MKTRKNYTLSNVGELSVLITVNHGKSNYYPYNDINEYLEVSCHFDRKTLKIEKFRNEEEWNYRSMRHEHDTLANWQGREQAINLVGESAIIEAEKMVRKNIRGIKQAIKAGQQNPLWLTLKPIADENLNHYKTDFYYHDCLILHNENPGKFIWLIRNTGTWLITCQREGNRSIIDYTQKSEQDHKCFFWNGIKLKEVELSDISYLYTSLPK